MDEFGLDLKDRKILAELEMNARTAHSALAKKVGVSKQVIKYRIEKLEKEGFIQGYNALINLNKLGETIYVIYLKLIQMSSSKENVWIEELNNDENVLAVGRNLGHWDITLVIKCQNNQELDSILKRLTSGKIDKIKEKLITSEIEGSYYGTKLLLEGRKSEFSTSNKQESMKLDKEDYILIRELSENCQKSLIELGEKLKMSPNGVKDKIRRLEEKKIIIGYKTKINYEKIGYLHFRVFLHLSSFDDVIFSRIKSFLREKGNVESVSRYIGYADVDFRCYCRGIVELGALIAEIKDKFLDEIIQIDSIPIFGWENINYYK